MTLTTETYSNVIKFLQTKGWQDTRANQRFIFFKPPKELGFDEKYLLPIPQAIDAKDFKDSLDFSMRTISGIYEKEPEQLFFDVGNYLEILKTNAVYFKVQSNEVKFNKTLEVSSVWNFLKNLSISYEEYIKIKFSSLFSKELNIPTNKIESALKSFLNLSKLRIVDLEYQSFSFGVSVDTLMDNDKIDIDALKEWRKEALPSYRKEVIEVNYNQPDEVARVCELFTEEERKKIYKPLFDVINADEYSVLLTDKNYKPKTELKHIPDSTVKIIVPIKDKIVTNKKLELVQVLTVIDANHPHFTLKSKDFENDMFIQKQHDGSITIKKIEKNGQVLQFKKPIVAHISVDEENQKIKVEFSDLPKMTFSVDTIEQVNATMTDNIIQYFGFYEYLSKSKKLLSDDEQMIVDFFNENLL
jgi:hypothetical protein